MRAWRSVVVDVVAGGLVSVFWKKLKMLVFRLGGSLALLDDGVNAFLEEYAPRAIFFFIYQQETAPLLSFVLMKSHPLVFIGIPDVSLQGIIAASVPGSAAIPGSLKNSSLDAHCG